MGMNVASDADPCSIYRRMQLHRATMDDVLDVLVWRNDADSIAVSKTPKPVEEADHRQWFQRAIDDPNRLILIAVDGDRKIGMVRFDRCEASWLVSINLAPSERDKGYGRAVLAAGIAHHRAMVGPSQLSAEIKQDNVKSLRLFESLGFSIRRLHERFYQLVRDQSEL